MYRAAMQSMVSELVRQDRLYAIESIDLSAPKTKLLIAKLKSWPHRALILVEAYEEKLFLAARNVPTWTSCGVLARSVEPHQARQGAGHRGRVETARATSRRLA